MLQDILMHGYLQNFKGFRQKTRKILRLQLQPIRAKCTCMRVRSCYFDHVIMSMLLIYPHIMSFKAFSQKTKEILRILFQPIRAKRTCMHVNGDHTILQESLIYLSIFQIPSCLVEKQGSYSHFKFKPIRLQHTCMRVIS